MPSWWCKRLQPRVAQTPSQGRRGLKAATGVISTASRGIKWKLAICDMSGAFFHAKPLRHATGRCGTDGQLGWLKGAMYGTRQASKLWQHRRLVWNPACCVHKGLDFILVVRGDDFLVEGKAASLGFLDGVMAENLEVKNLPHVGSEAGTIGNCKSTP